MSSSFKFPTKVRSLKDQAAGVVGKDIHKESKEENKPYHLIRKKGLRSNDSSLGKIKKNIDKNFDKKTTADKVDKLPLPDELKRKINKNARVPKGVGIRYKKYGK